MFNDVISDMSYVGCAMRGQILGVERRRFWYDDDKLEIVMSVGVGGASVTQVAQRHEIRWQQIYAWRHDLKQKGLWSPDAGALFIHWLVPWQAGIRCRSAVPAKRHHRPQLSCACEIVVVCILTAQWTRSR